MTASILWSTQFPYSPYSFPSCLSYTAWGSLGLISTDKSEEDYWAQQEYQQEYQDPLAWNSMSPAGDSLMVPNSRRKDTIHFRDMKFEKGTLKWCNVSTFVDLTVFLWGRTMFLQISHLLENLVYVMILCFMYLASLFLEDSRFRRELQCFSETVKDPWSTPETRHEKPQGFIFSSECSLRAKIGKLSYYFYLTISIFGLLLSRTAFVQNVQQPAETAQPDILLNELSISLTAYFRVILQTLIHAFTPVEKFSGAITSAPVCVSVRNLQVTRTLWSWKHIQSNQTVAISCYQVKQSINAVRTYYHLVNVYQSWWAISLFTLSFDHIVYVKSSFHSLVAHVKNILADKGFCFHQLGCVLSDCTRGVMGAGSVVKTAACEIRLWILYRKTKMIKLQKFCTSEEKVLLLFCGFVKLSHMNSTIIDVSLWAVVLAVAMIA